MLLACSRPEPPPPPPPLCEPVACLVEARRALEAGDAERAGALYAARCEALPGDVACALAPLAAEHVPLSEACTGGDAGACKQHCTRSREPGACTAAAEAWREGCEAGDGPSCLRRAEALHASGAEPQVVNDLLWVACDDAEPVQPWACLRLADLVERGHGRLPKRARGDVAWLRNQACDLQLDYACAPHRGW